MFHAGWELSGVVSEVRELTSEKNAKWRGYVAKVASLGITAEITVSPEQAKKLVDGEMVSMSGRFEPRGTGMRLVLEHYKPLEQAAPKPKLSGNRDAA